MLDAVSVCPEIRAKTEDRSLSRMVVHRIEAILHIQFFMPRFVIVIMVPETLFSGCSCICAHVHLSMRW